MNKWIFLLEENIKLPEHLNSNVCKYYFVRLLDLFKASFICELNIMSNSC